MGTQAEIAAKPQASSVSPKNTIDQVISIPTIAYSGVKKLFTTNEQRLESNVTTVEVPPPKERRKAIQSYFAKIDVVRQLAWNYTSPKQLERIETKVFEQLKSHIDGRYVPVANNTEKIWTIYSNLASDNIPIVLLHGFAGGVGLWCLNLDELCADRPVYAIDLPGFGRSSRPIFSLDPKTAENEFVEMLEEWRIEVELNKEFILLGHSFGGYLSACYALKYPKYVKQLVFIDSWGFSQKPENIWQTGRLQRVPIWLRPFSPILMKMSPLSGLRAVGPLGVPVIKYYKSDLGEKFKKVFNDDRAMVYLYHCNAQFPTGEEAFQTLSDCFAWAKEPLNQRIHELDPRIPMYFLHGEESWIDIQSSIAIQQERSNVFVASIKDAGHQVYADKPEEFAAHLKRILLNN